MFNAILGGDPLRNRSRQAAFLCYHSVHAPGPPWTSIDPTAFEGHLAVLRRSGWQTGAEDALRALAGGHRLDRPTAFLTFDDGYLDNYETVFPALAERGQTGLFFLLPPYVDEGAPFDWSEVEDRRRDHPDVMRSLTWPQAEAMAEGGMAFGSHGCRHRHLPDLSDEELAQELLDSRRVIAERLGSCDTIAYPFGEWTPRVAKAARDAGYAFGFTLPRDHQPQATPWSIPRIAVDHRDDERRFALKLNASARGLYLSKAKARLRGRA